MDLYLRISKSIYQENLTTKTTNDPYNLTALAPISIRKVYKDGKLVCEESGIIPEIINSCGF
jgi:hypothetical protein